jgi:hypothetical protein
MKIPSAAQLTDSQLVTEVTRLAAGERQATVALIVHLAEFDARRLFLGAGFSSTFKYCLEVLHLSEDAAYNRIEAARTVRRYPVVLDMLVAGRLSPTTTRLLARHLTVENHEALLAAASGKSKQEVETLLARLFPQADVPPSIRKLPSRKPQAGPIAAPLTTPAAALSSGTSEDPAPRPVIPSGHECGSPFEVSAAAPAVPSSTPDTVAQTLSLTPAPPVRRAVVRPLAADRYQIRFTVSAQTCEKLRRAQDLLGHALPNGDLAQLFDRALTLLVEDLEGKKLAATARPRKSRGQGEDSRNIPADVRRAVWRRDGGCCAFVASNGRCCSERRFLEFHHVQPYGADGKPTVDNIELRCRRHNRYEAELFYGPARRYPAGVVEGPSIAVYGSVTGAPVLERVIEGPTTSKGDSSASPTATA